MKYYIVLCLLCLVSCKSTISHTDIFADLGNVDFIQEQPYKVSDARKSSFYSVEYDSMTYIVRMPINSDSIVSVSQKRPILTEDEADSLRNNGVDLLIKIPLDSDVTLHLEDICKRYRSISQSYHRYVSLGKVQVDCKGNTLIRLLWKKSNVIYNIYISQSDGLNSLSNFPFDDFVTEKFYLDDYVQIKKDVYYRKVDMMEYNIANKRNFD